jgi:hypothetical protein
VSAQFSNSISLKTWCFASVLSTVALLGGCSSSSSEDSDSPIINDPISSSVSELGEIDLDLAYDPDGNIVRTEIVQVSGSTATQQTGTFLFQAPAVTEDETLVFEVSVTDNSGQTTTKRISVTVVANPGLDDANFDDEQLASCFSDNVAENANSANPWQELYDVETLDCIGYVVDDLNGIQSLINLENFYVGDEDNASSLSDLTPLSYLSGLKALYLYNNEVTDLSLLSNFEGFNNLHLINVPLDSFDSIANIQNLAFLHLIDMPLENLDFIAGHSQMKSLFLDNNGLSDISVVSNFSELEGLRLNRNSVTDLDALNGLVQLKTIKVVDVPLEDISAVASLTNLELIKLQRTQVTDIDDLVNLERLVDVSLGRSPIENLSALASMSSLNNLVYIELDVTDFSFLASLNQIQTLSFAEANLEDYSVFYDLDFLNSLELKLPDEFDCDELAEVESNLPTTRVISDLDC